ncbi:MULTISPECIES: hypothetical protein [Aerococcus]|uniref:Uncharacterized protein n=2 Tax=Aerococcus TaxID=1375 RepID=A0A5N1GJI9_9LACT|nr:MULTISPECIES: hypothetical protein [Aerococcus]KAA9301143.1 hypothetical protein F6I03_04545 [Aerococcus sanguinicola]MDK6679154.1 hypothetical protein [Aerococcus sp. UMB8608]MDK6687161.1 hypothetical protein [Aerococcus sp. UMB8623]MDK6941117.1 hypothetical protein [Aerococcus sp. UMB8487]OFK13490.1 hypothetical protein HMPREF2829_05805 [Aerococcus sp. HMSC072A12]
MTEDRLRKLVNVLICLTLLVYIFLVFSDLGRFFENLALFTCYTTILFKGASEKHGFAHWPSNLLRALVQMGIVLLVASLVAQLFPKNSHRLLIAFLILISYPAYQLFKQIKN